MFKKYMEAISLPIENIKKNNLGTRDNIEIPDASDIDEKMTTNIYGGRIFVCYVGKFNPFHRGHFSVYNYLEKLPYVNKKNIFICTDLEKNKAKKNIIEASGIPQSNIKNVTGYRIQKLAEALHAKQEDVIIVVFSQKDLESNEKQSMLAIPKDGVRSYQVIKNVKDLKFLRGQNFVHNFYKKNPDMSVKKEAKGNGYILIAPTLKIGNNPVSSSLIRENKNNKSLLQKYFVNKEAMELYLANEVE